MSTQTAEHLQTILTNVQQNLKQIDNQIVQGEQQLSVAREQRDTMKTLVAAIQHLIDIGAADAVEVLKIQNEAAVAEVASSPSEPAAASTP
jgi:predicted  nucleic acid-binding Zn-ribbon protein